MFKTYKPIMTNMKIVEENLTEIINQPKINIKNII